MAGLPLLCWDDSNAAASAIRGVASLLPEPRRAIVAFAYLPRESTGARLSPVPTVETPRLSADEAGAVLERGVRAAQGAGIEATGLPLAARTAADAIVATADEREASVIVLGQRPRSQLSRTLLGSVARGVVRESHRPVVIVGGPSDGAGRRGDDAGGPDEGGDPSMEGAAVLCWDGSEGARQAIRDARVLLGACRAIVLFAHVPTEAARGILAGPGGPDAPIMGEADAEALVEAGVRAAEEQGYEARPLRVVAVRRTADIIAALGERIDTPLIVMGQRKRSALGTLVLGSVAREVLARQHRPVLLSGPESPGLYPERG